MFRGTPRAFSDLCAHSDLLYGTGFYGVYEF